MDRSKPIPPDSHAHPAASTGLDGTTGVSHSPAKSSSRAEKPREFGGREGRDPTRYGDWEMNGRCIDF